jgi:hypothetical protein
VHNASDVRQIQVHKAEPFVLGPSPLEVEIVIEKSKSINRYVAIKFRQKWVKHEVKYYCLGSTNTLILFGTRNNCVISQRSLLLYQFTKRVAKLTVIIIVGYHCYQLHTKFYRISPPFQVKSVHR